MKDGYGNKVSTHFFRARNEKTKIQIFVSDLVISFTRWSVQVVEETLVHFERQLFILFWIHYRQRTERNYTFRKYPGTFWMFSPFYYQIYLYRVSQSSLSWKLTKMFFRESVRYVKCPIGTSPTVSSCTPQEATISSKVQTHNCMRIEHWEKRVSTIQIFLVLFKKIKACKTDSEGKVVEGKHTVYRMSAAEQAEKDEWIACIRYKSFFFFFFF